MKTVSLSLAFWLAAMATQAAAQCPAPAGAYYGGYATTAGYGPYAVYYSPYVSYAPFRATAPTFPMWSGSAPVARYGVQNTYFRGQPGPFAPPGGTFFGGYDYQITYPANWYGGYWGW